MKSNQDEFWVDEAIESYPVETLPEGFVNRVLAEIEPHTSAAEKIDLDSGTRFLYLSAPFAIFGFSLTAALLVGFSSVWMDPARVGYYRAMVEYWRLHLTYSSLPLQQIGMAVMTLVIIGGFAVVWRLTDPARQMDF